MARITPNMLKVNPERDRYHFKTGVNVSVSQPETHYRGYYAAAIRFRENQTDSENKYHEALINDSEAKQVVRGLIELLDETAQIDLLIESSSNLDNQNRFRMLSRILDREANRCQERNGKPNRQDVSVKRLPAPSIAEGKETTRDVSV